MTVTQTSTGQVRLGRALQLTGLHAKYGLIETLRIPMAVIGTAVFPALALLFFVVPQPTVANNPVYATQAVIGLAIFAAMANALFGFGLSIAEAREKPWDPYLRTLPAPGITRIFGLVLSSGLLGMIALIPTIAIGALFTAATAEPLRIVAGAVVLTVATLPFMLIGIVIGYLLPFKAAIAVIQILMFGLAFGGGLMLPPVMFPSWLEVFSRFLPSRSAREVVIWAVTGGELPWWTWAGLLAWSAVTLALALFLFRRDEGRRFR